MTTFFAILIATILGLVFKRDQVSLVRGLTMKDEKDAEMPLYDDLDGIGALMSRGMESTEDKIVESIAVTRNFFDKTKFKKIARRTTKKARHLPNQSKIAKSYAEKAEKYILQASKFALKFIPYAEVVIDLADTLDEIYSTERNLNSELMDKVLGQVDERIHKHEITNIKTFMANVKKRTKFINETLWCVRNEYEHEFSEDHLDEKPKRIPQRYLNEYLERCEGEGVTDRVSYIHIRLEEAVEAFTAWNSSFKQYSLLLAPILIELGLMVILFEPIAKEFIWGTVKHVELGCLYRDAMVDILPYVLEARFQKVNANLTNILMVRNEPFNPNGYNKTAHLQCRQDCEKDKDCLIDELAGESYTKISPINCEIGYLQYLRYLVEEMFPIDVLNETCNRPLGKPTGFGWATIKLKNLNATHLRNAVSTINTFAGPREAVNTCDQSWFDRDQLCDPYVRVKIGESFKKNEVVLTTEAKKDTQKYYVDRFVMSGLIQKNKTYIEIEVLDENEDGKPPDRLVWTSGTVEQFIRAPYRCSNNAKIRKKVIPGNCIEVDIVWQDQRDETKPQTTDHEKFNAIETTEG